jgi:hypothetical protein
MIKGRMKFYPVNNNRLLTRCSQSGRSRNWRLLPLSIHSLWVHLGLWTRSCPGFSCKIPEIDLDVPAWGKLVDNWKAELPCIGSYFFSSFSPSMSLMGRWLEVPNGFLFLSFAWEQIQDWEQSLGVLSMHTISDGPKENRNRNFGFGFGYQYRKSFRLVVCTQKWIFFFGRNFTYIRLQ